MLFVFQLIAMVIILLGSYFFSFPFPSFDDDDDDDDRTIKFFIKLHRVTIACLTNQWSKHLQRTESIKFIKVPSWLYDEESFCSNFLSMAFVDVFPLKNDVYCLFSLMWKWIFYFYAVNLEYIATSTSTEAYLGSAL